MGDEKVGETEVLLEINEEIEYLGLDGNIESRDRFVANQPLGLECKGAGDADTLALTAGELE